MQKLLYSLIFLTFTLQLTAQFITGEAEYIQEFSYTITTSHEGYDPMNPPFEDNNQMTVDLDGNGVVDMTFKLEDSHTSALLFTHSVTCQFDTFNINICQHPVAEFTTLLEEGVEYLADCENWVHFNPATYLILSTGGPNGFSFNPASAGTTYLAFKYNLEGEEVIGWIKCGFSSPSYFTLFAIGTNAPLDSQIGGNFTVSSTNIEQNTKISIHPNPTRESVFIDCSAFSQKANLKIYNNIGQEIQAAVLIGNETHKISLSNQLSGLYYFVINTGEENVVQKVILSD